MLESFYPPTNTAHQEIIDKFYNKDFYKKPLDVYVCSLLNTPTRSEMARQTIERWKTIEGVEVTLLKPTDTHSVSCPPEWKDLPAVSVGFANNFQLERRKYAAKVAAQSSAKYYIVADDDCLVQQDLDIVECVHILDEHPDFAILSLFPDNEKINEWTPDFIDTGYKTASDSAVMEHVSVGGVRFCRTGWPKAWTPLKGKSYDAQHATAIRKDGKRVGYFRYHTFNHLGKGSSTVNEQAAAV